MPLPLLSSLAATINELGLIFKSSASQDADLTVVPSESAEELVKLRVLRIARVILALDKDVRWPKASGYCS